MQILSGIGAKLGRFASRLAARHRAATEIRQLYQFDDRELRDVGLSSRRFPCPRQGHLPPRLTAADAIGICGGPELKLCAFRSCPVRHRRYCCREQRIPKDCGIAHSESRSMPDRCRTIQSVIGEHRWAPLQPSQNWFENYWYSQKSANPLWRVPAALATMAALFIAAWIA